jgi:hypothetical protein
MKKTFLIISLLVLGLVGNPALGEESSTDVGSSVEEAVETNTGGKPPAPRPLYPNAIERAEHTRDQIEARQNLIEENMDERRVLWEENAGERREQFEENRAERGALFRENSEQRRAFLQENIGERREFFASARETWQAEFSEEVKERVLARAEHFGRVFDAILERLLGLAGRMGERLETLAAQGADTGDAEAKLDAAYVAIEEADTAIEEAKTAVKTALESENPREALQGAKSLVDAAKEALRSAHEALKEAGEAVREAGTGVVDSTEGNVELE